MTLLESSLSCELQHTLTALMRAQRYATDMEDLCRFKAEDGMRPAPEDVPEIYENMQERMEILSGLLAETNTELCCLLENLNGSGSAAL